MEELAVYGLSGALVIKYLVNAAKAMGMSSKFARPLAMVLGILLSAGVQAARMYPTFDIWFEVVMVGLFATFGSSEVYDAGKRADVALDLKIKELEKPEK